MCKIKPRVLGGPGARRSHGGDPTGHGAILSPRMVRASRDERSSSGDQEVSCTYLTLRACHSFPKVPKVVTLQLKKDVILQEVRILCEKTNSA